MTEIKLAYRNLKRDINIYILLIISSAVFVALIISFQSTINSGDLGVLLSNNEMSDKRLMFKLVLWLIAVVQYLILYFFFNSYYRFINKTRVRELALYKIIGYSRKSIRKIIFTESILVYVLISLLSIILAFVFNIVIVWFINYQMQIETKLSSSLSIKSIIISVLILLILCIFNMYRTYKKAIKVDVDIALSDSVKQKKFTLKSKRYIIATFMLGLLLIVNMTYLSTKVTVTIRYGIIIIVVFYGYGIFLIINAITNGYQYLLSNRYKLKGFNLLLTSEINFHLNKSKFILLSSVVFMMMSIGALLLSQIMTDMISKAAGEYDYAVQGDAVTGFEVSDGKWSNLPEEAYPSFIYFAETNEQELVNLGVEITDSNTLLASPTVAEDYNLVEGGVVTYSKNDSDVNFKIQISDDVEYLKPYISIVDNLNKPLFSKQKELYDQLQILQREVDAGNVSQVYITKLFYSAEDMKFPLEIVSNSNFNEYLKIIDEKPISLVNNQVWVDGLIYSNVLSNLDIDITGQSYTGINAVIVSDEIFQEYQKSQIDQDKNFYDKILLKVNNKTELSRIDQELKDISSSYNGLIINSIHKSEDLGNIVFVLLIAFYVAVIFIICNFTLLAINLLSHGIENKNVYIKLDEMGISKSQKSKYISIFIRSFYIIPLIIGVISGLIATNYAVNLLQLNKLFKFTNISLISYILVLYIASYIIFLNITKHIYKRIINN